MYNSNLFSQYQKTVGGADWEYANSIVQTTDGGFIAAGSTRSFGAGDFDMYVVKFNSSGQLQWTRSIGGTADDRAWGIVQTSDGGYALSGFTTSFGAGGYDIFIVKLSSAGTLEWSKTAGSTGYELGHCITHTSDGGFAAAGWGSLSGPAIYAIKYDVAGTQQWFKAISSNGLPVAAYCILQSSDGGYVVAGSLGSVTAADFYIIKLDINGNLQWSRTIGGSGFERAFSIVQSADGGFVAAGETNSFGAGNTDAFVVKFNGSGMLQWSRTFGGNSEDDAEWIIKTQDEGYITAGHTNGFGAAGDADAYFLKFDANGSLQWSRMAGGVNVDYAYSVCRTTQGAYIAAISSNSYGAGGSDMYFVKFDSSGNTCGMNSVTSAQGNDAGNVGTPNTMVTEIMPTVTSPSPVVSSGGTVTTVCYVGIHEISSGTPVSFKLYQNYPNPFNPMMKFQFDVPRQEKNAFVTIRLYDVTGREITAIVSGEYKPGVYEIEFNASNYPSGIYYYRMEAGGFTETRKMVLIK